MTLPTVFEISGRMAMFRKPYTTTSSVSFPFPPPTALAGMIAAIVGIPNGAGEKGFKADFWKKMEGTRIALRILHPVSWHRETINFWNVKEPQKNPHIQVRHQFLLNPKYRIFVDGGLSRVLKEKLAEGKFVYTPYLGVAYALSNLEYLGDFNGEECHLPIKVNTVVPFLKDVEINVLETGGVFREDVPFSMDTDRGLKQSVSVLYSASPEKDILLKNQGDLDVQKCGSDVVAWFPAW